VQEPVAGDATEVSFDIEHAFIDIDVESFPGGSVATPGEPELFVTLPEQTAASLTDEALNAFLRMAFLNENLFATAPLTLTLYSGNPAGAGVAVSDALPLTNWTNVDEPETPSRTRVQNNEVLEFLDASGSDRIVTHLLSQRNGIPVARKELATPLLIPGYYGLRVPVTSLALQLTWQSAGDLASSWTEAPARYALRWLFAAEDFAPAQTTLFVNFFDGDPHTSGVTVADTTLTLDRSVTGWTVAGSNATSAAGVTGAELAPVGGWTIPFVVVGIDGTQAWSIVKEFDPPLFVPEGDVLSIPPGSLDVAID
jgi:hypothetical protein